MADFSGLLLGVRGSEASRGQPSRALGGSAGAVPRGGRCARALPPEAGAAAAQGAATGRRAGGLQLGAANEK